MPESEGQALTGTTAELPSESPNRFPCFDGLRAIAALSVLVFHFYTAGYRKVGTDLPEQLHYLMGGLGSFGVAVFFVISGFLLGRPFLVSQLGNKSTPRLGPFWTRRFVRIFPAYWLALAGLILFGLPHTERVTELFFHGFLAQGYIGLWLQGGIKVAWTLVAEVGFYLLLPFIAFGLRRLAGKASSQGRTVRVQIGGLIGLAVFGLGVRAWWATSLHDEPISFGDWFPLGQIDLWVIGYLDWFALGMLLAVASSWIAFGGRVPRWLSVLGQRPWIPWSLAAGLLWIVSRGRLPVAFVGAPTGAQLFLRATLDGLAAALVVLPAVLGPQNKGVIRHGLRLRPVVWLGVISYGIYLWHTIYLAVIARWQFEGDLGPSRPLQLAVLLALTIPTAALSYYLLERPLIRLVHRSPRQVKDRSEVAPSSHDAGALLHYEPKRLGSPAIVAAAVLLAATLLMAGTLVGATIGGDADPPLRGPVSLDPTARTVLDAFVRFGTSRLGSTPTGQHWRQLSGRWRAEGGVAELGQAKMRAGRVALATVAAHSDGVVALHVNRVGDGAGLAFRCLSPSDCWHFVAVPALDRWELRVIEDGESRRLGVINRTPVAGSDIEVLLAGSRVRVSIDGKTRLVVEADALSTERGSGIIAIGSAQVSKFSVTPERLLGTDVGRLIVSDSFATPGPLGPVGGAGVWRALRGEWTAAGGMASAITLQSAGPTLAILETTRPATTVRATIGTVAVGFGIAFRCSDANNCWWVEAAPGYGTWVVWRIVNGEIERVTTIGVASNELGTSLEVRLNGVVIDFVSNGTRTKRLVDSVLADSTGVGLATSPNPGGSLARFWNIELRGP